MDMKSLDRANEIQKRLIDLMDMRRQLEDEKQGAFLISPDIRFVRTVALSSDMRTVLLGMCIGESARLQKEFENL